MGYVIAKCYAFALDVFHRDVTPDQLEYARTVDKLMLGTETEGLPSDTVYPIMQTMPGKTMNSELLQYWDRERLFSMRHVTFSLATLTNGCFASLRNLKDDVPHPIL